MKKGGAYLLAASYNYNCFRKNSYHHIGNSLHICKIEKNICSLIWKNIRSASLACIRNFGIDTLS